MFHFCESDKPKLCLKAVSLFFVAFCLIFLPEITPALAEVLKQIPVAGNKVQVTRSVYSPVTVKQSVYGQKPQALVKPPVRRPPQLNPKDPAVIKTMQLARNVRNRMAYRVSRGGRYRRINYAKSPAVDTRKYRTIKVKATAYSPKDRGVGRYTFSEVRVQPNLIAVDPRVIPLGSVVYVPGYGLAVAADIGSAVKGKHIDLFMVNRKKALNWGKKYIEIYVYG